MRFAGGAALCTLRDCLQGRRPRRATYIQRRRHTSAPTQALGQESCHATPRTPKAAAWCTAPGKGAFSGPYGQSKLANIFMMRETWTPVLCVFHSFSALITCSRKLVYDAILLLVARVTPQISPRHNLFAISL